MPLDSTGRQADGTDRRGACRRRISHRQPDHPATINNTGGLPADIAVTSGGRCGSCQYWWCRRRTDCRAALAGTRCRYGRIAGVGDRWCGASRCRIRLGYLAAVDGTCGCRGGLPPSVGGEVRAVGATEDRIASRLTTRTPDLHTSPTPMRSDTGAVGAAAGRIALPQLMAHAADMGTLPTSGGSDVEVGGAAMLREVGLSCGG